VPEEPIVLAVEARDQATAIFAKIDSAIKGLGTSFGKTKAASQDAEQAASGWAKATPIMMGVGIAGAAAAAGVLLIAKASVDAAAEYQSTTADLAASAAIGVDAANKIGDAFLSTAGSVVYSAQEQMKAIAPLTGEIQLTTGHAINASDATKIMAASMDLAEASATDLGSATKDVVSVMKVYHLNVNQAAQASSILYTTARLTGQSVDAVATSVDRLEGRLGPLGPSLSDVSTLMVQLNKHGVEGRMAMMAATGGMNTLLSGSKNVSAELKKLGMNVFDSNGKFVGMRDIIAQLQPKLAGMTQEQRLMAERMLFGATAGRELDAVLLEGTSGYDKIAGVINKQNAAQAAAAIRAQTYANEQKQLNATIDDAKVMIGEQLLPVIQALIKNVLPVVTQIVQWINHNRQLTAGILIAVGVIGTLLAVSMAVMLIMTAVSLPILGIVIALALVGTAIVLAITHFSTIRTFLSGLWDKILTELKSAWNAAVKAVEGFVGNIWDTISGWGARVIGKIEDIWSQFSSRPIYWLTYLLLEAGIWFAKLELSVLQWGINMVDGALTTGIKFAKGLGDKLAALPGQLATIFINMVDKVLTLDIQMGKAAVNLAQHFWDFITHLDWIGLGQNIIVGILNGIKNGISSQINAFKNAANQIGDAFKAALGIHSPSEVMRVQVGRQVMQGAVLGTLDEIPAAKRSISAAIGSVVSMPGQLGGATGAAASGGSVYIDMRGAQLMSDAAMDDFIDKLNKRFVRNVLPGAGVNFRR
jgi:TP901 family phage tail tape measure protein